MQGEIRLDPSGGSSRTWRAGAYAVVGQEKTLIHELGHHADYESNPRSFIQRYHTDKMLSRAGPPSLEGAAEGYPPATSFLGGMKPAGSV